MGFLTSILNAAGGYGQGLQQKRQNQQYQQQIDSENAYRNQQLTLEQQKAKEDADAYQRSIGVDPATGKPPVLPVGLTQVAPGNKGRQPTVLDPNTGKPVVDQNSVDAQQLAHLYAVGNNYVSRGFPELAAPYLERAKAMESDMRAQRGLMERSQLDAYNQAESDRRTAEIIQGENGRRDTPTYADQNISPYQREELRLRQEEIDKGRRGSGAAYDPDKVQQDITKWHTDFGKATTGTQHAKFPGVAGSPVVGKPPAVSAKDISDIRLRLQAARAHGYKGPADPFSAIDADSDPLKLSQQLANMTGNQQLKTLLLERGRIADLQRRGQQQSQGGGSYGDQNPTRLGPQIPQRSIWDMLIENGATPQEATTLAAIAYAESSGHPGNVNPTDNHGKQTSWGLFQISDGTHNEPAGWDDPETNTRMAIEKLRHQGLGAWGTYSSGAYRQYLPQGAVANQ